MICKQDGWLAPATFAPSFFREDAFSKDEIIFFGESPFLHDVF